MQTTPGVETAIGIVPLEVKTLNLLYHLVRVCVGRRILRIEHNSIDFGIVLSFDYRRQRVGIAETDEVQVATDRVPYKIQTLIL